VLASRYVCEPLHLLDCSIDNDGGYGRGDRERRTGQGLPQEAGLDPGRAEAYYTDFYATINDPWFPNQGKACARRPTVRSAWPGSPATDRRGRPVGSFAIAEAILQSRMVGEW